MRNGHATVTLTDRELDALWGHLIDFEVSDELNAQIAGDSQITPALRRAIRKIVRARFPTVHDKGER